MKGFSTSLAIREMQIKTAMTSHLSKWPSLRNQQTSAGEDLEKRELCALLVGIQTGVTTVENSIGFPQKSKNGIAFGPSDPTAGNIP